MGFDDLLINECYLQTSYSSQNEWKDWEYTYSSASTPTICRLTPITEFERMESIGRFDDVRYFGYFQSSASLTEGNRLVYQGNTYIIKESIITSDGHHKEVLLSQIRV